MTSARSVSLSDHSSHDRLILTPYNLSAPSPKERQARYVDSRLVKRCRLDIGDNKSSPVDAPESHVGDLGTRDRNLLDHLARWSEDRDFTPAVVGNVEIAGFIECHAVWAFLTGEDGKILTCADDAVRLDRVAQDAVVVSLGQVDGGAIDGERDAIGKGQALVDPLQVTIREEAVEPADGVFSR